ncbi:MAG: aminoacyl-tRNA hydrolase [Proteobacteria bacterium]|nr:aminoacyl-tRNA hydrolase [Pseudomonadota bacterium]
MILLVGLGNPGPQYALNRHNVGFMVIDCIAHTFDASPPKRMGQAFVQEVRIGTQKVLLAKPMSYMNLSGPPVAQIASFYKIQPENIIVFHDELDLDFLRVRVKQGGGNGGHNGLKSLDAHVGKDYWRVRIGIGRPLFKGQVSDYVLSNFSNPEIDNLSHFLGDVLDLLPDLIGDNKNAFASKLATRRETTSEKGS